MRYGDQAGQDAGHQRKQEAQVQVSHEPPDAALFQRPEGTGAEALDGVDQLLVDAGDEGNGATGDSRDGIRRPHAHTPEVEA